jgi:cytochrome c
MTWRLPLLLVLAAGGCKLDDRTVDATRRADVGQQAGLPADVRPTTAIPARIGTLGHTPSAEELRVWDRDVSPDGKGLPAGRGTYAQGVAIYAAKCASCHGANGEGVATNPKLVGRDPREGFPFGQDQKYVKTIGNYWPYATTVYDYVSRAMPTTAPGSLTPNEVYSLVAFLLARNEIIDSTMVMDARSLPAVRMPARERFVRDDRKGGTIFR